MVESRSSDAGSLPRDAEVCYPFRLEAPEGPPVKRRAFGAWRKSIKPHQSSSICEYVPLTAGSGA